MHKGTILSVDDDSDLQIVLSNYLEDEGYTVVCATDARSALEKREHTIFDIVLLDLRLPDAEGNTLIPKLKEGNNTAVIVLSGKSDTTDKIVCLEMGADDYLTKPFEMRELAARIKAVLRRTEKENTPQSEQTSEEKIVFGESWLLDRSRYQLYDKEGNSAELTTGEFKLLEALILSHNRVLKREHLFELTRTGEFDAYDRAIDIQIARIRKKMSRNDGDPEIIKTVRGVGYMFTGEIKKG